MIPLHHGVITLNRVDHHEPDPGDFGGHCSLYATLVWTDQNVERYRVMHPSMSALCCRCVAMSRQALDQAVPGLVWGSSPIPDLAKLGTFN
jgi:hypothetical protein